MKIVKTLIVLAFIGFLIALNITAYQSGFGDWQFSEMTTWAKDLWYTEAGMISLLILSTPVRIGFKWGRKSKSEIQKDTKYDLDKLNKSRGEE